MDERDILLLASEEAQSLLHAHAGEDAAAFALAYKGRELPGALLATQLDLRRRAAGKLPTWVDAGCLFAARALEQCSSEEACAHKFEDRHRGSLAIDLTGGLGVDAWALTRRYERVVYVEADPDRCALARHNFQRLGLAGIDIVNSTAEDFVAGWEGGPADLVYADPDRRDGEGRRLVRLQDCAPDVLGLLPQIAERMGQEAVVLLKASPMLDVAALDAELQERGLDRRLLVLSIGNEVKELLAELGSGLQGLGVRALRGGKRWDFESSLDAGGVGAGFFPDGAAGDWYAYELDAAFYKARLTAAFFQERLPLTGGMNFADGYFFSQRLLLDFPGRVFRILEAHPYRHKVLRKRLQELGLGSLLLTRRHFDLGLQEVAARLGLKQGGKAYLLLTRHPGGERMALLAERLDAGMES